MDFSNMVQTTSLEEYAVPASVLFVFLLLIHQRHRLFPATPTNFAGEQHRRGVEPPGRIRKAASAAATAAVEAAAAEMGELEEDNATGSIESEGALEYSPSPSDSLSSNAEPEESAEIAGVGSRNPIPPVDRPELPFMAAGSRSATATSTGVRGTSRVPQISRLASRSSLTPARPGMSSRGSSASQSMASSRGGQSVQLKAESDDDYCIFDKSIATSTPLPPKRASTPRTLAKARGSRAFSPGNDLASDDILLRLAVE